MKSCREVNKMKKIVVLTVGLIFVIILTLAASCVKQNVENNSYTFDSSGIEEIRGTSQMLENVKSVVLSDEEIPKLLEQLDSLLLEETEEKNEHKGWEFFFLIKYHDGRSVNINLSKEQIVIDGFVYHTERYHSDDFLIYFQ